MSVLLAGVLMIAYAIVAVGLMLVVMTLYFEACWRWSRRPGSWSR